MKEIKLIKPTIEYAEDIMHFRQELLDANDSDCFAGCGSLKNCTTAENAWFTRKVLDERNIHPKKAIICCKNFHARRCLMYYQFTFPDTTFMIAPVIGSSAISFTKDNWYKTENGVKRVLGELNRLGTRFGPEFTVFKEEI